MVIKRDDVLGKTQQHAAKKKVSPERRKAMALVNSIDTGMTLTRFQIESADKIAADEEIPMDVEHFIKTAIFALSTIDTTDSDDDKAYQISIALESLALAVDNMDRDIEDVVKVVLNEIR